MSNIHTAAEYGTTLSYARLSSNLRSYAQERTVLSQIVKEEPFFGGKKGMVYKFANRSNLSQPYTTVATPETVRSPDNKLTFGSATVTLKEYTTAVQLTDLSQRLEDFDPRAEHQKALADWLAKTRDALVYNELQSTNLVYTPTGTAGAAQTYDLKTGGTPISTASRDTNAQDLVEMQNILADDYKAPPYEGAADTNIAKLGPGYLAIGTRTSIQKILTNTTSGIVDIRQDLRYAFSGSEGNSPFVRGYVGTWNGIHFIEDNFMFPKKNGATYYGNIVMCAADAVLGVTAMKAGVFSDPVMDGGRFIRLVMRGVWANKLVWNDATNNQFRVIRTGTA